MQQRDENLRPSGSFMGVPFATSVKARQAAILGVPFDCGTHPTRIGARQGPRAIREQSGLVRPYYPPLADANALELLETVDLGDVAVAPGQIEPSYTAIEAALDAVFAAGGYPVTFGGDGAVSLPQLRAAHRHYPELVLLHIDAHTDTYALPGYNTATTFTRAAEEAVIDVGRSFHIGARGTLPVPGVYEFTRSLGYQVLTGEEVTRLGREEILSRLRRIIGRRPVYLCFDMDYFDPSCAPGVATPTWGGPNAAEGLALLDGLSGLNIVSVDINTISPPHDVGGMSAYLAATIGLIGLHLIARGRGNA